MKFTTAQQKKIKAIITEEKSEVLYRIQELKDQDPFSDADRLIDNAASDTDASEESTHDRYAAMVENLELRIKDLEKVLQEVESGSVNVDRLVALVPVVKQAFEVE